MFYGWALLEVACLMYAMLLLLCLLLLLYGVSHWLVGLVKSGNNLVGDVVRLFCIKDVVASLAKNHAVFLVFIVDIEKMA